ncbi:MAG: carbohydrate ABC transporter permease [Gammaproteobacteria bacterium]|nr:carbohydrate ABC transporter permease [Gammaproteobacteria bacterium]
MAWLFGASLVILCLWVLLPLYLLMVNSVSTPDQIHGWPKRLWPEISFDTILFFWNFQGVAQAMFNSIVTAVITLLLSILLGTPAGYGLARFRFRGKNLFRIMVLMTRAFPLPLLALPLAVVYLQIGLDDTLIGVALVHTMLALPFTVLVTFSLFLGIPRELEEVAWTMGCTRWEAFRKVVLPLAAPGIAASAVFAFVVSWNEVFAAAILTVNNQTLTAFLVQSLDESPVHLKFAGGLVLVLPALVFIFAVRKYMFSLWGIASR